MDRVARPSPAGSPSPRDRLARGAAVASVVILLALVAQNLYWTREIDRTSADTERFSRRSHDLLMIAAKNVHPSVHGRMATYYLLGAHIAGATLTVPGSMTPDVVWRFERISRVEVVVATEPMLVAAVHEDALQQESLRPFDWFIGGRRRTPRNYRRMFFIIDPGATEYVLAESPDHRRYYLVSAARYAEVMPQ